MSWNRLPQCLEVINMNGRDLKNSILQLAIKGKLVEQKKEEGTAKELIEQIQAEIEQLFKDEKIKREKKLPDLVEEEIPFDIPESWEWVRLENLANINGGYAFKSTNYTQQGVRVIRISDFNERGFVDNKIVRHTYDESLAPFLLEKNNILLCMTGGTVGKSFFVKEINEPMMTNQRVATIKINHKILPEYINYSILSSVIQSIISISKNSTNDNISMNTIKGFPIPLPPLEEQKRIVAKIEELIPYVEKYDKAYSEVVELNKKFPEDMQKSILQYAVQGKLVEQRDEEGTAEELYNQIQEKREDLVKEGKVKKQKKLPEITEDEIPFDIPDRWKWVRLGDICEKIGSGSTPTGGKSVYKESGIKFLRSQNIYNDGLRMEGIAYISEEQNKQGSIVRPRDILLNITGGSIGRCALVPDDFDVANINQHVMIIRNLVPENRFLLHYILISPYIQSMIMSVQVGVSREGLSAEKLKNFLIPLPPLGEQKRIVAKIEELLPYTKQLVN